MVRANARLCPPVSLRNTALSRGEYLMAAVIAILININSSWYGNIAKQLNVWENYKYQSEHDEEMCVV